MTEYDSDVPVLLFRKWKIQGPRLNIPEHSLIGAWRSIAWPVDEPIVAKCLPHTRLSTCKKGPMTQDKSCLCGLHGYYSFGDAQDHVGVSEDGGSALGIVAGGGRILFDDDYARCQFAEIVALIDPIEYDEKYRITRRGNATKGFYSYDRTEDMREWVKAAAERYGVPLLGLFDAMDYASEFGVWIDGLKDEDDGSVTVKGLDF